MLTNPKIKASRLALAAYEFEANLGYVRPCLNDKTRRGGRRKDGLTDLQTQFH